MTKTAEELACRFHEAYERLALSFGYQTREDTKAFDPGTPNGKLMIAVCGEVAAELDRLRAALDKLGEAENYDDLDDEERHQVYGDPCLNSLHQPKKSSDVPEHWICPDCHSRWWDIREGIHSQPLDYLVSSIARQALENPQ